MTPILNHKRYDRPSVLEPANLLREARRQKALPAGDVPEICVLDPDGDFSRHLRDSGARRNSYWACYHTELYDLDLEGTAVGVLGCAVGSSFAVLVAEATGKPVTCFAHVTNQMGMIDNDFEKGEADGNKVFMNLLAAIAQA